MFHSIYNWKVFLFIFILNTLVQRISSIYPLCVYNWKSVKVLEGLNISERFHLKGPLEDGQTFLWSAPHAAWNIRCNNSRHCVSNAPDAHARRMSITPLRNNTFEMRINSAQTLDSGIHRILVNNIQGKIPCTALILALTVVDTSITCITHLDIESEKLQFSCEWLQVGVDIHTEMLVGNHSLYTHQSKNPLDDDVIWTDRIIWYTYIQDISDGKEIPTSCVAFHRDISTNKTCHFSTLHQQTITYEPYQDLKHFNCCVRNQDRSVKWWVHSNVQLYSFGINKTTANNILFICGEGGEPSEITVHNLGRITILNIDVPEHQGGSISMNAKTFNESDRQNNSTDELRCETISVNVTTIDSRSTVETHIPNKKSTRITTISSPLMSTTVRRNKILSYDVYIMWISVTSSSTLALVLGIGVIFILLCYFKALRRRKYQVTQHTTSNPSVNSATEEEDTVGHATSHEMTTFPTQPSRPLANIMISGTVSNPNTATSETNVAKCETVNLNEHGYIPSSVDFLEHSAVDKSNDNIPIGTGLAEGLIDYIDDNRKSGQHHADRVDTTAASLDSAYSSVDDTKSTVNTTKKTKQPSFLWPLQSSADDDKAYHSPENVNKSSASDFLSAKPKVVAGNASTEINELYAKPDLSKKTRKVVQMAQPPLQESQSESSHRPFDPARVASSELSCGNLRNHQNPCQSNISSSDQLYSSVPIDDHLYGNDNTDSFTNTRCSDTDLYVNSSIPKLN